MSAILEVNAQSQSHEALILTVGHDTLSNTDTLSHSSRCHRHVQLRIRNGLPDQSHTDPNHLPLTAKESDPRGAQAL